MWHSFLWGGLLKLSPEPSTWTFASTYPYLTTFWNLKIFSVTLSKVHLCCWEWRKVSKNGHSDQERFCSEKPLLWGLMAPHLSLHIWKAPPFLDHLWIFLKPKKHFPGDWHHPYRPLSLRNCSFNTIEIGCWFGHFPKVLEQNQLDFWILWENSKGEFWHPFFVMTWSSRGEFDLKI